MVKSNHPATSSLSWLGFTKRYLILTSLLNFSWEILQLPLYTIWVNSSSRDIAFAVVHCTVGDAMIATFSLAAAVALMRKKQWPDHRYGAVAVTATLFGLAYTIYSEWNNTVVTQSWAYAASMPRVGGIGLSPLAQWIAIPVFAFSWLNPQRENLNARL